jgi:hypothetical protein
MRVISAVALVGLASALATGAYAQVDRYGGSAQRRPTSVATAAPWQARSASGETGRFLSWPGKLSAPRAEAAPPAPMEAPRPAETPAYAPTRVSASVRTAEPAPARLPTSIYDTPPAPPPVQPVAAAPMAQPPAAQPAPSMQTARRADGPRFYSVHRDFGIAPDAAPIPPQFFADTADLAEPPPPTAWDRRNVTSSDGKTTTVVRRATGSN